MFGWMKSRKNSLVAAANKQFELSLPNVIHFVQFINADKKELKNTQNLTELT